MAKAKYTCGKDGYYQARIWDGTYCPNSTKHRVTLRTRQSSKHLEEMVRELADKVRNRETTASTDSSILQYARRWLTVYKANAAKNTVAMYDNIIEKHLGTIAHVRLSGITKTHILLAVNGAAGMPRTQEQLLMTLKQVVKAAISDRYLPAGIYLELFDGIRIKKTVRNEKRALTDQERRAVFTASLTDMQKAFVFILYGCGLRRGEALALSVPDLDFANRSIRVTKSLAFDKNDPYIKPPKTSSGVRTVPIPDMVLPYLESYCMSLHQDQLFYTAGARYMSKSSFVRMWKNIQTRMDSPRLTAHLFRHNYCTTLCYQIPAISIKKIAELMGDREKMVIDVYNHILSEREDVRGALENALNF